MFLEGMNKPITEFDRNRLVKRKARFFGQDDIGEPYLSEPDDNVGCRIEIWRDG